MDPLAVCVYGADKSPAPSRYDTIRKGFKNKLQQNSLTIKTWSFWADVFLSQTSITMKLLRIRSSRERVTRTGATWQKSTHRVRLKTWVATQCKSLALAACNTAQMTQKTVHFHWFFTKERLRVWGSTREMGLREKQMITMALWNYRQ